MINVPNIPMMNSVDIDLISSYLSSSDIMLEWGSGGSTLYFSPKVQRYYSIEHNEDWVNSLYSLIPQNVDYYLAEPDLSLTEPWTKYEEIKTYVNSVDHLGVEKFDKVLIDGRGRGFCAIKILDFIHENSLIFIHDFWTRECRGYFEVFKYYDIVDYTTTKEGLIVLKKKKI